MTQQLVTKRRSRFKLLRLPGDIIAELKKVVWLTRREAAYLTFLVLVVAVTVGIVLAVVDYSFARLVDEVFLGR